MKQLTRLRGYTDQMVEAANAVLCTFGSYRLGVIMFRLGFVFGAVYDFFSRLLDAAIRSK